MYIFGVAMSEGKFRHQLDVYGIHPHTAKTSAVLTYRLWIVWNKHKKLTYILPIIFSSVLVLCLVVMTRSGGSVSFYSGGHGCLILKSSRIVWIGWLLVLFYNTGEAAFRFLKSTALMGPQSLWRCLLSKRDHHVGFLLYAGALLLFLLDWKGINSSLLQCLYRDGA